MFHMWRKGFLGCSQSSNIKEYDYEYIWMYKNIQVLVFIGNINYYDLSGNSEVYRYKICLAFLQYINQIITYAWVEILY